MAESAVSDGPRDAPPAQPREGPPEGLPGRGKIPISPPLELLWEEEESYVIRLPRPHHGTVVQIARGLVDGVVTGEVLVLSEGKDSPQPASSIGSTHHDSVKPGPAISIWPGKTAAAWAR